MDTLIRAAAKLAPDHPDLTVAIAGTGRDRLRLDPARPAQRRTRAPARPCGRRRPALAVRVCRRVRHVLPDPMGRPGAGGLRHRVPGGAPRVACRRSPAPAGGRPTRSTTGRPASSSTTPTTPTRWPRPSGRLLDDPALRLPPGTGGPPAGGTGLLLRPAGGPPRTGLERSRAAAVTASADRPGKGSKEDEGSKEKEPARPRRSMPAGAEAVRAERAARRTERAARAGGAQGGVAQGGGVQGGGVRRGGLRPGPRMLTRACPAGPRPQRLCPTRAKGWRSSEPPGSAPPSSSSERWWPPSSPTPASWWPSRT